MRRRGVFVVLALASLVPACIFAIDPLPGSDAAEREAGAPSGGGDGLDARTSLVPVADATIDGDATDLRPDASSPINLLVNGGFEGATTGSFPCGSPWGTFEAKLASDTTAHTGANACRVCSNTGTPGTSFTINYNTDDAPRIVDAGTALVAQAWARAVPGASTSQNLGISIRIYDTGNIVDRIDCPTHALGNAYAAFDCQFTTTKKGLLNVYLRSDAPGSDECFLVDDFRIAIP